MMKSVVAARVSLPLSADIEQSLLAVPGVRTTRVILDSHQEIAEIHVIGSTHRSPKKIVRDIESFLMVQYGYRVDFRRISLVQIGERELIDRISLSRVEQIQQASGWMVEVELINGTQRYAGHSNIEDDATVAAGAATVHALNNLFAPRTPLVLGGIEHSLFGQRHALIAYLIYNGTAIEHTLGTTFVRSNAAEAAARAVLAATNRRLGSWFLDRQSVA